MTAGFTSTRPRCVTPVLWRGWIRAQGARDAAYAERRRRRAAAEADPSARPVIDQDRDQGRDEKLLAALENVATAGERLIEALVTAAHDTAHRSGPGAWRRSWRRTIGPTALRGPLAGALTELAGSFADPWTACAAGGAMACGEVDTLARVLDLAGHPEQAARLLCGHAETDDHGDTHAALRPLPDRADPAPSTPQLLAARHHLAWLQHRTPTRHRRH